MKKLLFIIAITLFSINTFAQGNKSVFLEFGGNGLFISANYDARFNKTEKGLGYRVGVGFFPGFDIGILSYSSFFTIPVGLNYLAGHAPHYFEGGLGATYFTGDFKFLGSDEVRARTVLVVPTAGYRYAPSGHAFQGRIFAGTFIGSGEAVLYGGLSVGFKF
jgi:hypothetical protein